MDSLAATTLEYQTGFANAFESEAIPGALPLGRNSPQKVPFGLYAEQLSGTAFTASQDYNRRSWLYRIRPSVRQGRHSRIDDGLLRTAPIHEAECPPDQMRWDPAAGLRTGRRFRRRARDTRRGGRSRDADRDGLPRLLRRPFDGGPVLLQRRRRDADRPAAGAAADCDRVRGDPGRAGRDRGHPARHPIPGRTA